MPGDLKIAFVHDWLTTFGGGEQVLAALWEIWPEAPVYTLVHDPEGPCGRFTAGKDIRTSVIQRLPGAKRNHRRYLPLMPLAVEQFDLRGYDVVISISHAVAHGVLPQPDQLHIRYVCTPMRYAWHLSHQYLHEAGLERGLRGGITKGMLHYLRLWDAAAAGRADQIVAISGWTAQNVWRAYRRSAEVIYPPVEVERFTPCQEKDDYYLTISRLVPYKRVGLIVEAFTRMPDRKLVVIGDGPDLGRLRSMAGKNVTFTGFLPFEELKLRLENARAFVYAAVEDFGIVPVEAMACGTPVIAYGKGGLLETVIDGETGLFFAEQTAESLMQAVLRFESGEVRFVVDTMRRQAERFSKRRFQDQFTGYLALQWQAFLRQGRTSMPGPGGV